MKNRTPMKPNRYAVYDDTHTLIGYQYHERADEPTEVGDALDVANLLPDALCTLLGIPTTSVPKDALQAIADNVQLKGRYFWRRYVRTYSAASGSNQGAHDVMGLVYYSSSCTVVAGVPQLVSPSSRTFTASDNNSTLLNNKYFKLGSGGTIYYGNASNITYDSGFQMLMKVGSNVVVVATDTFDQDLSSRVSTAYPQNAENGGYYYAYYGDGQIKPTGIAAGEYTGIGNYGSGSPNSLVFPIPPLFVFIVGEGPGNFITWVKNKMSGGYGVSVTGSMSGNTLSWYATSNATQQLNVSGQKYPYIYIY